MSMKEVLPIKVDVDAVALSLLGWEAVGLQARLVRERIGQSDYANKVAVAGELRFHPDRWRDRYDATNLSDGDGYLPDLVWQLRSARHGPIMGYQTMTDAMKAKKLRAPRMISESMQQWYSTYAHASEDLSVHITAVDWAETDGLYSAPSTTWRDVPVEFLDQTTRKSVRTEVRELVARVRGNDELEVTLRALFPLGSAEELLADAIDSDDYWGDPDDPVTEQEDFMVQAPDVTVSIFDGTGFLLEDRTLSNHRWVKVGEGGQVPRRWPTLIARTSTDLDDLAGTARRVVVRVTDPEA